MTVENVENTQEKPLQQEKVDAIKEQPKVDTKIQQNEATEDSQDPNWKAFREARKRDRAEREAAEKRAAEKEAEVAALKAAMEAAFAKSAPTPQAYQQYHGMVEEESEDDKIEKKVNAILADREAKLRKEQAEREYQEYPNRLRRDFPDFNAVVSQENLDYIDYHYPEISRPLQRLPEGYDRWHDIYHAIKKFVPNHQSAKKDAARADINSQKPRSISSPTITQSGENTRQSWQEIEQRRAANWERMERLRKSVG